MDAKSRHTQWIKEEAFRLGFDSCGVSKAEFLEDDAPLLESWLKNGYHGKMTYMENHFDKRLDPRLLMPGANSVISLTYNYFPEELQRPDSYKLSKYAFGEDYHKVVKDKLRDLVASMQEKIGNFQARVFTDSAPIMERSWAQRAGLGWIGKHSLLIRKSQGSFFFLAEIISDLELSPDKTFSTDHCGTCTRCLDACPTEAIIPDKTIDASKCISYFTIELKDDIPDEFHGKFDNWMFGCDICLDVCPWNRFSKPHNEPRFAPSHEALTYSKSDWEEITEEVFTRIFKKSAVQRTKFAGLKRNLDFLKKQSQGK